MIKLTARQQQVLDVVRSSIEETGYPPTRAEIARELKFKSANAAEEHLKALARKGAIEMIPGASRGIRLAGNEPTGLAVVGRVAAGAPVLAQENIEERVQIPGELFHPRADYLLRVSGNSMVNAGIFDGDLIAVHSTPIASENQIVVARIEDEVTVKRLQRPDDRRVLLIAENEAYEPIEVDLAAQNFCVEGVSVGVLRRE